MPPSSPRPPDLHPPQPHCPHGPCIDLHADGTVRTVHAPARRVLQASAGLLWLQGGRLAAAEAGALQRCLDRAHAGQPAGLALRRSGRLPLTLRALPVAGGAVLVTLRDPEAEQPDTALLRELFGLTPAEAHVAACLALGQRTATIAAGLGVQANTVQAHLKSIYAKTGCRHQAALLSLVLRSAAVLPVPPVLPVLPLPPAGPPPATHPRDQPAGLARLGIARAEAAPEESAATAAQAQPAAHPTTNTTTLRDPNR